MKQFEDLKIKYNKIKEKIISRKSYGYHIEKEEKNFLNGLIDIIEDKESLKD